MNNTTSNPFLSRDFWDTATPEKIEEEIIKGANILERDVFDWTALHQTANRNSDINIIKFLSTLGLDVNHKSFGGWTALHIAAQVTTNPNIIDELVLLGADVNARDNRGETPTFHSVKYNSTETALTIMSRLVQYGADINIPDFHGWTPLHQAAIFYNKTPDKIIRLLDLLADPFVKTLDNKTVWELINLNENLRNTVAYTRIKRIFEGIS